MTLSKSKTPRSWFTAIFLLALALRLGAALILGDTISTPMQQRIQDQVSYNALAQSLLEGKGYSFDTAWYPFTLPHAPTAHWSFLYPAFLAAVYALTGFHPLAARLVQVLLSSLLLAWLYYRLGKRLFGEKVGLVSAGLAAFYAYFIFYDAALMTESFYIFGVLALLELTLAIADEEKQAATLPTRASLRLWVLFGAALGITALLRQVILVVLPVFLVWIFWAGRYRRSAGRFSWQGPALAVAILALFILPWTARNYRAYGEFLPLNSNAGFALYSANHPNQGTHFDQDYVAPLPSTDHLRAWPNEAQWNSWLTSLGIQFVLDDPARYLLLSLGRVPIFFNFWFSAESSLSGDLMRIFSYGLYLPFFLLGLVLSWKNRSRTSLVYLFAASYSLLHILTWASVRYRLPVDAAMMPFAALAVATLGERVQARLGLSLDSNRLKAKAGRMNVGPNPLSEEKNA